MKLGRLAFASLLASSLAAQTPVLVVDDLPGPGVDHTNLRLAMEAAPNGAVLLLREGSYNLVSGNLLQPDVVIDGKGLHVVGDSNALVGVFGRVTVQNLSAAQSFSWLNLDVQGSNGGSYANRYLNCLGWAWYESVVATPNTFGNALQLQNNTGAPNHSTGALIHRSSFRGHTPIQFFGSHGVTATEASVHAYDSHFFGGFTPNGPHSGTVLEDVLLQDSYAFVSGSQPDGTLSAAASGSSSMDLIATTASGASVPPVIVHGGPARSLASNTPVREGQAVQLEFNAPAGEIALLNLSSKPMGGFLPIYSSSAAIDVAQLQIQVMGIVPASGKLVRSIPTPANLVNGGALLVYSQASFVDLATFGVRLGGGSLVVVLDSMY